jgi:hypothetical protein
MVGVESRDVFLQSGPYDEPRPFCDRGRLPSLGKLGAEAVWIAFVVVQACDGVLTAVAIHAFGMSAEGNPLILWYAHAIGPTAAVCGAKLFGVGCGAVLHLTARHGMVAALTVWYLLFAIGPWLQVLALG